MTTNGGTMTTEERAEALSAFAETIAALTFIAEVIDTASSDRAGAALAQCGAAVGQLRAGLDMCPGGPPADLVELFTLVHEVQAGLELEHTFALSRGMRAALRAELEQAHATINALNAALAA